MPCTPALREWAIKERLYLAEGCATVKEKYDGDDQVHRDLYCGIDVLWAILTSLWLFDLFELHPWCYWVGFVLFHGILFFLESIDFLHRVRKTSEDDYKAFVSRVWLQQHNQNFTSDHPTVRILIKDKKFVNRFACAIFLFSAAAFFLKVF